MIIQKNWKMMIGQKIFQNYLKNPIEHLVANNCKKEIMKGNFAQHFDKWIVMMMLMIE
jgi:hypothetical protein